MRRRVFLRHRSCMGCLVAALNIQVLCCSSDRGHDCSPLALMKGSHQSIECFGERSCMEKCMQCAE